MPNPTECIVTKATALALAAGLFTASAHAVVTYPGPFVGANLTYTDVEESSADPVEDPEPLYGAPSIIAGDNLDFNPTAAFIADAPPPDTTDASLRFNVASNGGGPILSLLVSESGDYQFSGSPSSGELVAATLLVRVLDATTQAELATSQAVFTELYDNAPLEVGNWSNSVNIDLSAFNRSEVIVVVNNLLQATGVGPANGFIRKTDFDINVPEPASALLALSGGLMLLRRRQA